MILEDIYSQHCEDKRQKGYPVHDVLWRVWYQVLKDYLLIGLPFHRQHKIPLLCKITDILNKVETNLDYFLQFEVDFA